MFKNIQFKIILVFFIIGIAIIGGFGLFFINSLDTINNQIQTGQVQGVGQVINEINKLLDNSKTYIEGANKVVDMPEFKKMDVTKDFLNALTAKDVIADVMTSGIAKDINVYIGSESEKEELKNFSIITFNHLLDGKDIGTIGIIGPTRMDYSKVISVIKYISKKLNDGYKKGKF